VQPIRQNSWESSGHKREDSWEVITVKKRYSPGDLFSASTTNVAILPIPVQAPPAPTRKAPQPVSTKGGEAVSPNGDEEEDWFNEAPQVVVARSVSVKRANSQRKLLVRPIQSGSRTTVTTPSIISPASTSSTALSAATSATSFSGTSSPVPVVVERLTGKKDELKREIWGDIRETALKEEDVKEARALTPQMCVVENEGRVKSVWGMIETA
jgi:hypothetical protein